MSRMLKQVDGEVTAALPEISAIEDGEGESSENKFGKRTKMRLLFFVVSLWSLWSVRISW